MGRMEKRVPRIYEAPLFAFYSIYPPFIGDTACSEKIFSTPEVYLAGFGVQFFRRTASMASISSGVFFSPLTPIIRRILAGMSISIKSSSSIRAIGPPSAASGDTWPMAGPLEAPENRPSVMSAMLFDSSSSEEIASVV